MGYRQGSYAKVWAIKPISETCTELRISITKKNKETDQYEDEFSGFIRCYGTAAASKAAALKEKDKIKLGDVDVCTSYNKEKNVTYTNYKCFSFEMADAPAGSNSNNNTEPQPVVDDGEVEDSLPF